MMTPYILLLLLFMLKDDAFALEIELLECSPPDFPQWGGYGPRQDFYVPGDSIHYYCDVDTYIGGNYYRRCEDNGDWSGETPVCDSPALFSTITQSSTAEPIVENDSERANDGVRTTCSSTRAEEGATWTANLENTGHMLRVMVFQPTGDVAYEVFSIREDNARFSCGRRQMRRVRLEWDFHNCLEPNNTRIKAIEIKSLSSKPLQLCEVVTHVLTDPTCVDPHYVVENGRFEISRKTASLVCDNGYTRSTTARLECVRTGVWNRKTLYCIERQWELEGNNGGGGPQTGGGPHEREPLASNSERERAK